MNKPDDQMLDDLFALGRAKSPQPSEALLARIARDAEIAQSPQAIEKRSVWAGLFDFIGGWPSVGGLAVAGVTGVWFGIAPPASVTNFAADLIGTSVTVDLLNDTSDFFTEAFIDG